MSVLALMVCFAWGTVYLLCMVNITISIESTKIIHEECSNRKDCKRHIARKILLLNLPRCISAGLQIFNTPMIIHTLCLYKNL